MALYDDDSEKEGNDARKKSILVTSAWGGLIADFIDLVAGITVESQLPKWHQACCSISHEICAQFGYDWVISSVYKNIVKHTAYTIVPWPNP